MCQMQAPGAKASSIIKLKGSMLDVPQRVMGVFYAFCPRVFPVRHICLLPTLECMMPGRKTKNIQESFLECPSKWMRSSTSICLRTFSPFSLPVKTICKRLLFLVYPVVSVLTFSSHEPGLEQVLSFWVFNFLLWYVQSVALHSRASASIVSASN